MVLKERVGKSGLHEGANPLKSTDQCPFCLWLESRVHASSPTCNIDKLHTHTQKEKKKKKKEANKERWEYKQANKQTKKRKHANKQRNRETHIDICNKCRFGL